MFGIDRVPSEVKMVAARNEHEAVYEQLRTRLVASARKRGVPVDDVEDVVHDTLGKLLQETVRPGAPRLEVRAFAALSDKRVEYFRQQERRAKRLVPLALPPGEGGYELERPEIAAPHPEVLLFEMRETIAAIAGADAMRFVVLRACGATEEDIAILLDWTPQRAAAARVRLGRKKAEIAAAITDITEGGNRW